MAGKIIVIEGATDGIGKSTQKKLLLEHLDKDGQEHFDHHFPTYGEYQSKGFEEYLSGEFGDIADLSPYFVNSLLAHDRTITWRSKLTPFWESGKNIIFDRYTTSSLIYQSAMLDDMDEKLAFLDYVVDFEYNKLSIPEPDQVFFLNAPYDLVYEMRTKRTQNDGIQNDLHESNQAWMRKVYENAQFVAKHFGWTIIECAKDGKMHTPEDIHEEIYQKLIISR